MNNDVKCSDTRNISITEDILKEKIRNEYLMKVTEEIQQLSRHEPKFVKRCFNEQKLTWQSFSENEINGKYDYERSRMDNNLWNMLEKSRKARNA